MGSKPYETPEVITFGALEELTTQDGGEKCAGSADLVFPRVPDTCDFAGVIPEA